jgi:hypothetical protein
MHGSDNTAASSPSGEDRPPLEKSRLEFFSASRSRAGFFAAQPVETHREIEPTPTKIVSGMSCWLSRDPIGEYSFKKLRLQKIESMLRTRLGVSRTGSEYHFVKNDPISHYDILGLDDTWGGALRALEWALTKGGCLVYSASFWI